MAIRQLPSPEELRQLLIYSPETGKLTWRERGDPPWDARYAGKAALTGLNRDGYPSGKIHGRTMAAHRVIWALCSGEWPSNQIDHINGDRSDNRISNLRHVTHAENGMNQKRRVTNTTGYTGVTWRKDCSRWQATIRHNGRAKHLGYFDTAEDAHQRRREEQARLGFHPCHGKPHTVNGDFLRGDAR